MRVDGIKELNEKLRAMAKKSKSAEAVIVGYTQDYAVYVHECTWMKHKAGKQAKFLEGPARRFAGEMFKLIEKTFRNTGGNLTSGLLIAGLRLQRESQKIVPIDTTALKASAYTAKEKDAAGRAAATKARAEALRRAKLAKRRKKP